MATDSQQKLLYHVQVKNGYKLLEEGNFFPGLPFSIEDSKHSITEVRFQRGSKNKLVYALYESKQPLQPIAEWTHPDYVPEEKPGQYPDPYTLDEHVALLCAAFSLLQISKDTAYLQCFPVLKQETEKEIRKNPSSSPQIEKKPRLFSFTIRQEFSMRSMQKQ